jgi:hypothetical protein
VVWPREGEDGGQSPELSTGGGGCGDPGEVKLAWVVHEVCEDAAMLLVRLAWPEMAWWRQRRAAELRWRRWRKQRKQKIATVTSAYL